ncbi:hypothetical protein LJC61_05270 [Ruminococcaceae bacterium OttesenSCG-928-A16]|nr:hypothetical protein [Ruminococcaceae bacterium OttesenSCG-928-A16]
MMRRQSTKTLATITIVALAVLMFSSCNRAPKSPEDYFVNMADAPMEYVHFNSFDVREMPIQIAEYNAYVESNMDNKSNLYKHLNELDVEPIPPGVYTVGKDIAAGEYYLASTADDVWASVYIYSGSDIITPSPHTSTITYFVLKEGQTLYHESENSMLFLYEPLAFESESSGVYYEGSYQIDDTIKSGTYFTISTAYYGKGTINTAFEDISFMRFGYVHLNADMQYVNLRHCILIELKEKPLLHPVWSDVEEEYVYPQGMYKAGEDIPLGKYRMVATLYDSIYWMNYSNPQGNYSTSHSDAKWNTRGITIYNKNVEHEYQLDLDSYDKWDTHALRKIDNEGNISYSLFDGDPIITISDEESYIAIDKCILVPLQ